MPGEFRKRELVVDDRGDAFVVTHLVDDSHDGWRADCFLGEVYRSLSRNKLQGMIESGRIRLVRDGAARSRHGTHMRGGLHRPGASAPPRLKASSTLLVGDRVEVRTARLAEPTVDLDYRVLHEDEDLLVIDKPGNLPVHPAGRYLFHTLLMDLRRKRLDCLARGGDFHLVHRLDRETSGVIALAKHRRAARWLVRQFRERETRKLYAAVVAGHCPWDSIEADFDLGSDRASAIRLKMAAFPKGQGERDARTRFRVLRRGKSFDLVECELFTGRQHQIRVHLSALGLPLVGDKLYGVEGDAAFLEHLESRRLVDGAEATRAAAQADRHALHSRYLRFRHEGVGEGRWVEFESPPPPDMEALLAL